ncbi:MAG: hypothetical protein FJ104_17230 [Deltaproteobacteria bacterium]|nr:hypothetical protein [Deltaproteobacteria bacterium]
MSAPAPVPVQEEPPVSSQGSQGRSPRVTALRLGDGGLGPVAAEQGLRRAKLTDAVASLERRLIEEALRDARGNAAQAARMLGTTERIIRYKAGKLGIDRRAFRS